jgi:hypothetical protein
VRALVGLAAATALWAAGACREPAPADSARGDPAPAASAPSSAAAVPAAAAIPAAHLRITGTSFQTADGSPFSWRGLTALRLLDHLADGRTADVEALLDWAASKHLTVVRTLAMGGGWMNLTPEDGRAALPRLLALASERGLHVEIVALAGTLDMPVDLDAQVAAVGRIAADHPNALVEIANEPSHPTQNPDVRQAATLSRLAGLVPDPVPVSFGSVEEDAAYGGGDYVTWHAPRRTEQDGWAHVLGLADGARLLAQYRKPVVSDEPIGAAAALVPGRRDDAPPRFRAAALVSRLAGMGATFHYEGGLEARVPDGVELACFDAWNEAWSLLPAGIETTGTFAAAGEAGAAVRAFDRTRSRAVFERHTGDAAWVAAVGGSGDPDLILAPGWHVTQSRVLPGVALVTLTKSR